MHQGPNTSRHAIGQVTNPITTNNNIFALGLRQLVRQNNKSFLVRSGIAQGIIQLSNRARTSMVIISQRKTNYGQGILITSHHHQVSSGIAAGCRKLSGMCYT